MGMMMRRRSFAKYMNINEAELVLEPIITRYIGFCVCPQLPQSELEGLDPSCRRFRLENGESIAEKDEVRRRRVCV